MTPSNGNPKPTKLHPDDALLFGWLDEETLNQPKRRRRSTSSSIKKSSKADGSKNTTQAKINDIIITATTASSSSSTAIPSSSTGESRKLKTVTPTKLERQHILQEFEKAFPKETLHVQQQQQQQQQYVAKTKSSSSSHNDGLEECLASAGNSHFLQLAPDYDGKKKLKKVAHNSGAKNKTVEQEKQKKPSDQAPEKEKKSLADIALDIASKKCVEKKKGVPEHPEKQNIMSSDKALDIASKKGKRHRDMRQQRHEQYGQQQQLAERKKEVEHWIRNTPLNGYASTSFDLLPAEPLKHIASYLAAPSRAIFDVALNGDKLDGNNSRGVAGDQFDILDFGEIENSLAGKLRDRHLKAILLRIDAVNLKRLKLTNCVEIRGSGLDPLRGSRIIEQIDLNIIRGRKGWNAQISSNEVQPILDSIIERECCALKHLQFSKVSLPSMQLFLRRYTEMLRRRNRRCWFEFSHNEETGLVRERHTCYGCLTHFCGSCQSDEQSITLRSCNGCAKYFCLDCSTSGTCASSCSVCSKVFCKDCDGSLTDCHSSQCDQKVCSDCTSANKCSTCKRIRCKRCSNRRIVRQYGIDGVERFQSASRGQCASCFRCSGSGCRDYANPDFRCKFCDSYFCGNCFLAEGNGSDGVNSVCLGCSTRECASWCDCDGFANPNCYCIYCDDYFCVNCFGEEDGHVAVCSENHRCASCGTADPERKECVCCEKYFCDGCAYFGYSGTMCVECDENHDHYSWAMPQRSRPERHVVYGDAFTSAPIIGDAFYNGPDLYNGNGPDL